MKRYSDLLVWPTSHWCYWNNLPVETFNRLSKVLDENYYQAHAVWYIICAQNNCAENKHALSKQKQKQKPKHLCHLLKIEPFVECFPLTRRPREELPALLQRVSRSWPVEALVPGHFAEHFIAIRNYVFFFKPALGGRHRRHFLGWGIWNREG